MAEHSERVDGRVDFGGRVFLTWAFIPIILSLVMNAVAFGQTGNLIVVLWGLLTLALLVCLANALHAGSRRAERITLIVGGVYLALAIAEAVLAWGNTAAMHVALQCLTPPLLALMLFARPIRLFFASQRGETLPEESTKDDATAVSSVPRLLYIVSLLLVCAAAGTTALTILQLETASARVIALIGAMFALPVAASLVILAKSWSVYVKSECKDDTYRDMVVADARTLFNWLTVVVMVFVVLILIDVAR